MTFVVLNLPFPPSVNTYWRAPTTGKLAGRHLISEKGRAYRKAARDEAFIQFRGCPQFTGRLDVEVKLFPPDRRKRDIDNFAKGLLDALTHAGIWQDDEQIDRLLIERCEPGHGRVVVRITERIDTVRSALGGGE